MKVFILLSLVAIAVAERKRFDGCEVWDLLASTDDQLIDVHHLYEQHRHEDEDKLIFWEEPRATDDAIHIMACTSGKIILRRFLAKHKIAATKSDVNVQKTLDDLWARNDARHEVSTFAYDEEDFNTYEDIMAQLDVLQANCPSGVTCTVDDVGSTYEGRLIKMFRITKSGGNRQGIWMDSLIHAREWLAGTTNLGILTRLVNEYGSNADATRLVDTYDWHFMPVVNPDGYSYTWTSNRNWRKNRTPNQGQTCIGTDLNRNHNFMWGTQGSDTWPCSETYRGATASSEPAVAVLEQEGERLRGSLILWMTWHTTANLYLYPFGTVENGVCMVADDNDDLDRVGQAAVKAIGDTYNTNWRAGSTCGILYAASATTQDWAYGTGLAKYSYTPELRGPGFAPDKSNIAPSTEENWNGLVAMINEIEAIEGTK